MSRRTLLALALAVPAALLSACVQVPEAGPVVEAQQQTLRNPVSGPYSDPAPPPPHANPGEIVTGFLDAMTAVPLQTNAARQYLTTGGRTRWQPQNGLVVYGDATPPRGSSIVTVRLHGATLVSGRGLWRGRRPHHVARTTFPMRLEHGEWRIARAPNALLVPAGWYAQNFQTSSIFFFDPSGRILVPEPVHVPSGDQLATALVRALVLGPVRSLDGVANTFIPAGLSLSQGVVVHGGVADVTLRGSGPGLLNRKTTRLVLAQFSWTLAQVPDVHSFQVTIGGDRVSDASGNATFPVASPAILDPTDSLASGLIYALRGGRLVSGQAKAPGPVDGPFGNHAQGITSFAASLDGIHVAGVTPTRLLLGSVQGGGRRVTELLNGTRLLRPGWDFAGRLWDIDAAPQGASVVEVADGTAHSVTVPGITASHVTRFLISRDGSRLVAAIRGPHGDRIAVSRIRYTADGDVAGASRAVTLPWQAGGSTRIRDLGWLSPTTIGVLHLLTNQFSEVRTISVDGSTQASQAPSVSLPGRARGLATSPVGTDTSFAILRKTLYDLAQTSPDVSIHRLRAITYAG